MDDRTILKHVSDSAPQKTTRLRCHAKSVPPDVLRGASHRLALMGLVMAFLGVVWSVFYLFLSKLGVEGGGKPFDAPHFITMGMVIVSVAVYFLAKSERMKPQQMLDFGLFYLVAVAFVAGVGVRLSTGHLHIPTDWAVSELCILIIIFPVIVPNTPGKTLLAAVLAASMDPLGVYLAVRGGQSIPEGVSLFAAFFPNYLCAVLALIPSMIMLKLAREVSHAREMGSYRLDELLGKGGMGEVWRATHRLLVREAALKLIRPDMLVGKEAEDQRSLLKRFEREAQATSLMCSPHTINLYDFGVSYDGTFYYVMELLNGFDLQTLVRKYGPVRPERAAHFLKQICDSLAEAHEDGLIHRDIKPANVYVCRYGREVDFVKVLDFGLVKPRPGAGSDDAGLTQQHVAGGTPAFMAPEQVLGDRPVDARTDLYAVGCLGYWLLTGQEVFEGETSMKVMMHHVQTTPIPPSQRSELAVPPELDNLLLRCLEKDPARRPQSADELAGMLRGCLSGDGWAPEKAHEWWDTHLPRSAPEVRIK
jgi:serine/threonine-protein kinase